MINKKKVLALIPARSGSKGLRGKNLLDLHGKPLVAWPIEVALESRFIDRVVVSTNSKKIAEIANKYGADTPFLRPRELATDTATSADVVLHALDFLKKQEEEYEYIVLLEPTSPLTSTDDVDKGLKELHKKSSEGFLSIVSVSEAESTHPIFCSTIKEDGSLKPLLKRNFSSPTRRQDIDKVHFFDGSFYISQVSAFYKYKTFYHKKTIGFKMPQWQSYEIDNMTDFTIIKAIMESRRQR